MFSIGASSTLVSSGLLLNTQASPSTVAEGSTSYFPTRSPFHKSGVPGTDAVKAGDAKDVLGKLSDDIHPRLSQHIKSKL